MLAERRDQLRHGDGIARCRGVFDPQLGLLVQLHDTRHSLEQRLSFRLHAAAVRQQLVTRHAQNDGALLGVERVFASSDRLGQRQRQIAREASQGAPARGFGTQRGFGFLLVVVKGLQVVAHAR